MADTRPNFVQTGGTLFYVTVDGERVSEHTTWHVAIERAWKEKLDAPGSEVRVKSELDVRVEAEEPVVSDSEPTPEPEPEPGPTDPATVDPIATFDPDVYTSTDHLRRTEPPFGGSELGGPIFLDTDAARPGGSKSMRYDYDSIGIGNSMSIGRRIPLPAGTKEVFFEAQLRWSANFFDISNFPQDGSTFAHKLIFAEAKAFATDPNWETSEGWNVYRWNLLWPGGGSGNPPNGQVQIGPPRLADGSDFTDAEMLTGVNAADYFDERWHTVRVHWRHDPGACVLWIDGSEVYRREGFTVHPEIDMTAILLGRNKDDGIESGTESLWWGKMDIYTADPGW